MKKFILLPIIFIYCIGCDEDKPNTPNNLRGDSIYYNTIQLNWNDNSDNENGFIIERSENDSEFTEIAKKETNQGNYRDTNLNAKSEYRYRVKAFNDEGNSSSSNIITFTPRFNLKQLYQVNHNIFSKYFASSTYTKFDDIFITKMNNDVIPGSFVQLFLVDRQKGSIFFIPNKSTIFEFNNSNLVKEPAVVVADIFGHIFISDVKNNTIIQFKIEGPELVYANIFYENIKAIDMVIDNDTNIYAIDSLTNSIVKINKAGKKIQSIAVIEGNGLRNINCISIDKDNQLYIVDNYKKQLYITDMNGSIISKQYINQIIQVTDIAVSNNSIYLVSNNLNKIYVLRKSDYKYIGAFTAINYGEPLGQMSGMHSLAVLRDLNILAVLDINGGGIYTETAFDLQEDLL